MLDAPLRQSVAAVRALGRAGYHVGTAGYRDREPMARSRYVRQYHRLPDPHGPEDVFVSELERVVRENSYQALLLADDATLARLAESRLPAPSSPVLGDAFRLITDKVGLVGLCAKVGIAYPPTFLPTDVADAERILSIMRFPVVVKAARSAEASPRAVREQKGAAVADDRGAAIRAYSEFESNGLRPIIQQRIDQAEKLVVTIFRRGGRSELRFVTKVLRMDPPRGGIGSALESVSPDVGFGATAIEALEKLCDVTGYEGLACSEWIISTGDRTLYLVEVNPRLWGSLLMAERLNQRVAERCVRFALGVDALPETRYPVGRRFHHIPSEVRWVFWPGHRRLPAMATVLRSSRPWDIYDRLDLRDPVPLLIQLLHGG